MEHELYLSGWTYESIADGPGIRAVFFVSGCTHNCAGCHSPTTHDFKNGTLVTDELIEEIRGELKSREGFIDGITLSGGDPFCSPAAVIEFLERLEITDKVWAFTGYDMERLCFLETPEVKDFENAEKLLREYVEVLVDGPFEEDKRDITLRFKGSLNQRIIDVPKTLTMWQSAIENSTYKTFNEKLTSFIAMAYKDRKYIPSEYEGKVINEPRPHIYPFIHNNHEKGTEEILLLNLEYKPQFHSAMR